MFIFQQNCSCRVNSGEWPDSCIPVPFLGSKVSVLLIDEKIMRFGYQLTLEDSSFPMWTWVLGNLR